MDSGLSESSAEASLAGFKILIAGGFGAGKTTLVSAISEVRPLRTEEALSSVSMSHDDLQGVENKTATTVAMDFGRITLGGRRVCAARPPPSATPRSVLIIGHRRQPG